jgi:hypothetical protein
VKKLNCPEQTPFPTFFLAQFKHVLVSHYYEVPEHSGSGLVLAEQLFEMGN